MRRACRSIPTVLFLALAGACGGDHPTASLPPDAARAGNPASNPKAAFSYHHFATGIAGDGRSANGTGASTTESVYSDGMCGVTAQIFAEGSGDATMDPIGSKTIKNCNNKVARKLIVTWGAALGGASFGPAEGGHFTNVRDVMALANVGESGERLFTLLLRGSHTCERVRYDASVTAFGLQGSAVRVTRTASDQWVAESIPNAAGQHVAFCQVGGSGGDGAFYDPGSQLGAYDMPVRIIIALK
jgi:hypothetical protein